MGTPFDSRLTGIIKSGVAAVLKPCGFRKEGNTFVRRLDDLSWVINIQKSLWNSQEKAEFTLNCGVYVPGVFAVYGDRPEPESPTVARCCLNARIGELTDRRDVWWTLRAEDDPATVDEGIATDVRERLERGVLPFLNRFKQREDVVGYLGAPRPREERAVMPRAESIVLAYLGILQWLLGHQEQSRSTLARAEDAARKQPNEDHIRALRARLS